MDRVLDCVQRALSRMQLVYTVQPDLETVSLGLESESGQRMRLMFHASEQAEDITIYASLAIVTDTTRTRVAQLLAEEANVTFKNVTFGIVDDRVVVTHVVDLEFATEPEAMIRKGIYRVVCAVDEMQDAIILAACQTPPTPLPRVVWEAEQMLDDLGFV